MNGLLKPGNSCRLGTHQSNTTNNGHYADVDSDRVSQRSRTVRQPRCEAAKDLTRSEYLKQTEKCTRASSQHHLGLMWNHMLDPVLIPRAAGEGLIDVLCLHPFSTWTRHHIWYFPYFVYLCCIITLTLQSFFVLHFPAINFFPQEWTDLMLSIGLFLPQI